MQIPFGIPDTALNEADKDIALPELMSYSPGGGAPTPTHFSIDLFWILFYFEAGSSYSAQAGLERGSAPAVDHTC